MRHEFTPEFIEKFWLRVDNSGGLDACHPWTAGVGPKGYGAVYHNGLPTGCSNRAHVVAFLLSGWVIPEGHEVCHSCDSRPCCNVNHLRADTHLNNIAERNAKGRQPYGPNAPRYQHEPRGIRRGEGAARAKLTEDQVRQIRKEHITGSREFGTRPLARKYGVRGYAIDMIVQRKSWKHIE